MFMCLKPNVFLLDTVGLERGYEGNVVHGVMGLDWPKHTYTYCAVCVHLHLFQGNVLYYLFANFH